MSYSLCCEPWSSLFGARADRCFLKVFPINWCFMRWVTIIWNFLFGLTHIFVISCAGFVKLKMQNKLGAPVAFVDFKVYVEKSTILPVPLISILIYFLWISDVNYHCLFSMSSHYAGLKGENSGIGINTVLFCPDFYIWPTRILIDGHSNRFLFFCFW